MTEQLGLAWPVSQKGSADARSLGQGPQATVPKRKLEVSIRGRSETLSELDNAEPIKHVGPNRFLIVKIPRASNTSVLLPKFVRLRPLRTAAFSLLTLQLISGWALFRSIYWMPSRRISGEHSPSVSICGASWPLYVLYVHSKKPNKDVHMYKLFTR